MTQDNEENFRRSHDLRAALLSIKQIAELMEAGFNPTQEERKDIADRLRECYGIFEQEFSTSLKSK